MRAVSTETKIVRLAALLGTQNLSAAERRFIEGLRGFLPPGQVEAMSEKQVRWMDAIHRKHFA